MTEVKITRAWLKKLNIDEFTLWIEATKVKWDIPKISFLDRYPEKDIVIVFEDASDATAFKIKYGL